MKKKNLAKIIGIGALSIGFVSGLLDSHRFNISASSLNDFMFRKGFYWCGGRPVVVSLSENGSIYRRKFLEYREKEEILGDFTVLEKEIPNNPGVHKLIAWGYNPGPVMDDEFYIIMRTKLPGLMEYHDSNESRLKMVNGEETLTFEDVNGAVKIILPNGHIEYFFMQNREYVPTTQAVTRKEQTGLFQRLRKLIAPDLSLDGILP